jgi:hypothetical protein
MTTTTITAELAAQETAYFFMIMGNLAAAKAASDADGIADAIADLDMMAKYSDLPFIAERAAAEAAHAAEIVADTIQPGFAGVVLAFARPVISTPLN